MRVLIIFYSKHHFNTKKVAKTLAKTLKADLINLTEIKKRKKISIKKYDLIGFGSGIYHGRHHPKLFQLIDQLKDVNNKKAFIFSTSGAPPILSFIQHRFLKKKLIEKGFKIVKEICLPGWDTYGLLKFFGGIYRNRPNKKDLNKARKFAELLLKKYV